jgi:hypothetical protein
MGCTLTYLSELDQNRVIKLFENSVQTNNYKQFIKLHKKYTKKSNHIDVITSILAFYSNSSLYYYFIMNYNILYLTDRRYDMIEKLIYMYQYNYIYNVDKFMRISINNLGIMLINHDNYTKKQFIKPNYSARWLCYNYYGILFIRHVPCVLNLQYCEKQIINKILLIYGRY